MKYLQYKNISLLLFISLIITGCLSNTGSQLANPSDDASILQAYIKSTTYSPNASLAVFTIDNVNDSIYNVDSLPYGTKVDSLFVGFQFASSLGFIMNDTVSESNFYNTAETSKAVDFTKRVKVKNLATDEKSTKEYEMELRVHKVETYLHVWSELNANVTAQATDNQKAVQLNDKFFYYFGHAASNSLYTSTDAKTWKAETALIGLPLNAKLRDMVVFNNAIYLLHNGLDIYKTTDGINWAHHTMVADPAYNYTSLLFAFKNKIWAVAKEKTSNNVRIANSADGVNWAFTGNKIFNDNFPVTDFASTTFRPKLGREKVVVIGGFSPSGKRLNTLWSAENVTITDTLNWLNLQNAKSNIVAVSDAAVEYYGSKLMLFSGATNTLAVDTTQLRQSMNEGMNWILPDSATNILPDNFKHRTHASVIKDSKDNSLYVIGGKSSTAPMADVWKIKVNFYSFKDYLENPYKY